MTFIIPAKVYATKTDTHDLLLRHELRLLPREDESNRLQRRILLQQMVVETSLGGEGRGGMSRLRVGNIWGNSRD